MKLISAKADVSSKCYLWCVFFLLFATVFASAQSCTPPAAGIVSWWPGQSNALDQIGTNNGIWGGTPSYAPGEVGLAFNFNSTFVRVPDSPSLHFTTGMTAEAWVKPANFNNYGAIITKADAAPLNQTAFALAYNPGGTPYFFVANTNNQTGQASGPNSLPANQWTHIAGTYDGSMVKLYLNGVLVSSNALSGNILSSTDDVGIGDNVGGDTNGQSISMFIGLLDEPTLYSRALTASEIAAIYNAGSAGKCSAVSAPTITVQPQPTTVNAGINALFTVTATGNALTYQWQFNSAPIPGATTSSFTVFDAQPANEGEYSVIVSNAAAFVVSSNALLTVTTPTCTPAPAGIVSWWAGQSNALDQVGTNNGIWSGTPAYAPGAVGLAFNFNSTFVRIPDSPSLHFTTGMTAEAWVNPANFNNYGAIITKADAVSINQTAFALAFAPGGTPYFYIANTNQQAGQANGPNPLPLNQWTHIAGTYDGSMVKLYLNGVMVSSNAETGNILSSTDDVGIGDNVGGDTNGQSWSMFFGFIDEPTLYSRALTASEIAAIYNAGSAGKCSAVSAPTITVQPQPESVPQGSNALFTVTANGTAPLTYQWQFNNAAITGATAPSLNIPDAQPANEGEYSVIVSNAAGFVISSNAFLTVEGSSCTPPPAGIVNWWAGENNTVDQVGGDNGTWSGTPAYAPGEVGSAFSFNGNNCVRVPDAPNLHFTNAMTAEAWVHPSTFGSANGYSILVKYDAVSGVNQGAFSFGLDASGQLYLLIRCTNSTSVSVASTATLPLNQWTHVAGTYDSSSLKIYINGSLAGSVPASNGIFPGTDALGIGANIGGESPGQQVAGFIGSIDEATLYNTALSASQIAAIYNAGSAGKCSSVTAPTITIQPKPQSVQEGSNALFTVTATGTTPLNYQWQFNNAPISGATLSSLNVTGVQPVNQGNYSVIVSNIAGSLTSANAFLTVQGSSCTPVPTGIVSWWAAENNALDQVSGNNGSLVNGASYGPGQVGTAFSLNGNNQCVRVPDAPDLRFTTAMTAEAWIKLTQIRGDVSVICSKWDAVVGPNQRAYALALDASNTPFLIVTADGQNGIQVNARAPVPTNVWTHIAATYDGSRLSIYVNGALNNSAPFTGPIFAGTDDLAIGAIVGGEPATGMTGPFPGFIDEASLYSNALSASQVTDIYNAGPEGKCIVTAPTITLQPQPESVPQGSNALFTVTATGTAPLTYQWQFNNTAITGATASSLNIPDAQPANQGEYSVIVSNAAGFVISSNALLTLEAPSCTPPAAGLVSWWAGESNTVDQVGGNNGTWSGAGPSYGPGEVGMAFSFNGNDCVRVADAPNLHFSHAMTAEAWVNPSVYNGNNGILVKYDAVPGVNQSSFSFAMDSSGHPYFLISSDGVSGSARLASSNTIPLNQWSHVAGTFDSSTLKVYVNGVLTGSMPATNAIFPGTDALGIGANIGGISGQVAGFSGFIDEASLYDTALSASQIAAIYNAGPSGKCNASVSPTITVQPQPESVPEGSNALFAVTATGTAPLTYQWQFNNAAITGATASSLNIAGAQPANQGEYSVIVSNAAGFAISSNALLTVESPSCTPAPAGIVSWWAGQSNALDQIGGNNGIWGGTPSYASGEVGLAFNFNSTFVRIPDSPSLHFSTGMTAEAWVKPSNVNNYGTIIAKADAVSLNQSAYALSFVPGGAPYFYIANTNNQNSQANGPNPLPVNQWTHIAGTYDGSIIKLYINGVLVSSNAQTGNILSSADDVGIGDNVGGDTNGQSWTMFFGLIDEPTLYSRALSASEIASIYNAGAEGKCMVTEPPAITLEPQSQTVYAGTNVTFTAAASGTAPLLFQWNNSNGPINGATNDSFTITDAQPSDAGSYFARVSNSQGSVTSSNAILTVLTPASPSISEQPVSQTVTDGTNVLFTVTAAGSSLLSYQWEFNNAPISGATGSALNLTAVQPANDGNYSVVVSNYFGTVTSSNATLTVIIPSCTPTPAGIVSWWAGESNTIDQVSGNNGIWGGTPSYVPGEVGLAFNFNSTFVRIPDSPSLHFSTGITAEAWVKPSNVNNYGTIIAKADAVPINQSAYALSFIPGGTPYFYIANTNNQNSQANGPNPLPVNQWTHIAGTYDGSMIKLYINGVLVSSNAQTGNILSSADDVGIGDNVGGNTSGQSWTMFFGLIDEPTLYSRALSASEIASIYNAGAAGKCAPQIAPSIVTQPQNQTITAGSNVTFNVVAAGSKPLRYQWFQNSQTITGATDSSLVLTNVPLAESGYQYSVLVSNLYGTVTSSNAILTVLPPPSTFVLPNLTATSGIVTVPITFVSDGQENAIGFSVNFNSSLLAFVSADAGTNANATLIVNTNDASSGEVGLAISLPYNTTFNAGSNILGNLTFELAPPPNTNTTVTPLTFGNTPIPEQVYDPTPNQLAAVFTNGSLTIPFLGYEADVFPVPNGDGKVLLNDWVETGRIVAGLDAITSSNEFQRADCAPRSTLGDGRLTVSDWIQAGRYAAGLDSLTVAGGPTMQKPGNGNNNVVTGNSPARVTGRNLSIASGAVQAGQTCQLSVMLAAQGDENGLEFTLSFPPNVLSYVSASVGANANGASLILNTKQVASGNLGVLLALPTGSSFAAGNNEALKLTLKAAPIAAGSNMISFNSLPLTQEVSDATANAVSSAYVSGSVTIVPILGPRLSVVPSKGSGFSFSYPSSASGFNLQSTTSLNPPNWTNAVVTLTTNGNTITATGSMGNSQIFYRLVSP